MAAARSISAELTAIDSRRQLGSDLGAPELLSQSRLFAKEIKVRMKSCGGDYESNDC
jgi:hypothetical protein